MATGIPLPGMMGDALLKGVSTGGDLFTRIMQPILEREKQKQAAEQFAQHLALQKQQEARLGANSGINRRILEQQLLGLQHKNDPMYELNQFAALQNMLMGGGQGGQQPQAEQMPIPTQAMGEGMGMFSPEGLGQAQQTPQQMPQMGAQAGGQRGINLDALRQNPMLRGFFKHKFGYDPLAPVAETPEQKRLADLQSKMEFEQQKTRLKKQELENKELVSVKKDLPTLEKSLKGVNELLNIAKNNPDMFGHTFMPDIYAKTSKNKNFGTWQNLISDAIAGLEQKLSSRGNIVALKMAAQLKPSHAEQQPVAIGKLESMKKQIMDSINHSKELLGQSPLEDKNAQTMDLSQMSDDELQRIASGG